MQIKLTNQIPR